MSDYALLSNTSYCAGCTYGKEVEEGARSAADELGMETLLHGTHKTKGTEIAGVVISIKNADCDMLLLGTAVKDTITLYATLRKLGWEKPIVGSLVLSSKSLGKALESINGYVDPFGGPTISFSKTKHTGGDSLCPAFKHW